MDVGSRDSNPQSTLEEEPKKSNTDCVYFLASPLTCIKGADCEYRHSENARMNPRDCWFWLNGNCLNLQCAFRHPPLDGCRGLSGDTSIGGTFQPSLPPTVVPAPHPHYASTPFQPHSYNRQKVPCYYFQMGSCLKGDKCQFMHGPQPPNEPALPKIARANLVSDPQATNTFANGSEDPKLTQKNLWPKNSEVGATTQRVKAGSRSGFLRPIGNIVQKNEPQTNGDVELAGSIYTVSTVHAVSSSPLHSQEHDEQLQNHREVDEGLGESPPGFDVLVSDGEEEEEYFDPDSEIVPGHGGMHLSSTREFDRMMSYTLDEFEREEREAYNAYGQTQERIGWDQDRAPPERLPERMSMNKRRLMLQEENLDRRGGQDLRHSLWKRRRPGGSGGITSSNRHADSKRDDRLREDWHQRHSSREQLRRPNTESSVSNRLRGRVRFPGRPSPDTSFHRYSDAESEKHRVRERSSPSRPGINQGRYHEKSTGRTNEDIKFQVRISEVQNAGSEEKKTDSLDFAGPKSLAELKGTKISETREQISSLSNRQAPERQVFRREGGMRIGKCSNQDSGVFLSFDGPKPLSDILKRKREVSLAGNTDAKKETGGNTHTDFRDSHSMLPPHTELKKDVNEVRHSPEHGGTTKHDSTDEVQPFQSGGSPAQAGYNIEEEEDALMLDPENPCVEDREAGIEEENQDQVVEEEYSDGDDDFARKLGVMFT